MAGKHVARLCSEGAETTYQPLYSSLINMLYLDCFYLYTHRNVKNIIYSFRVSCALFLGDQQIHHQPCGCQATCTEVLMLMLMLMQMRGCITWPGYCVWKWLHIYSAGSCSLETYAKQKFRRRSESFCDRAEYLAVNSLHTWQSFTDAVHCYFSYFIEPNRSNLIYKELFRVFFYSDCVWGEVFPGWCASSVLHEVQPLPQNCLTISLFLHHCVPVEHNIVLINEVFEPG